VVTEIIEDDGDVYSVLQQRIGRLGNPEASLGGSTAPFHGGFPISVRNGPESPSPASPILFPQGPV